MSKSNPKYPIYIISKGRWNSRLTAKALEKMSVAYRIVVEPQEAEKYSEFIDSKKILVLPFSNLGQGSIPARNWVWEHSISEGHERHWILDDNIRGFHRLIRNRLIRVSCGACFRAIEDFVDRYTNVPIAGMQYKFFAPRRHKKRAFCLNTRIYSCILLSNSIHHRWRGRYNEDTDLSIRILKDGFCSILFYSFLANKAATMTMSGGNTDSLYRQGDKFDGRLEMARSLQNQHPDIVKITWKWGRWQHQVDYSSFRKNKLRRKKDLLIEDSPDEYSMRLVPKKRR